MMPHSSRFRSVFLILAVAALGAGVLVFIALRQQGPTLPEAPPVEETEQGPVREIVGRSIEGRVIDAYTYGEGATRLLFVGGVHGGYEWNSVLLAYAFIDHLDANPEVVPGNLSVTVIPALNPDGLYEVTGVEGRFAITDVSETGPVGTGRFNANGIDLNRNFDCKWQPESRWRGTTVSAGAAPFSEPEAAALRDYVVAMSPTAVVFWHSQANTVYASECEEGILPDTLVAMDIYARAAGYAAVDSFDAYPISGDAEGWLASIGIPAITVELASHESVEWNRNRAGIEALFTRYGSVDSEGR